MSYVSQAHQSSVSSRQRFNQLAFRAYMALIAVIAIAGIEIHFSGLDWRLGGLIFGSLLSLGILMALSKGARHRLAYTLSYLPYLFGLYLFFIEGFFRLTQLLANFSAAEIGQVVFYFVVGSSMASFGYNATLQAKRLRQGH